MAVEIIKDLARARTAELRSQAAIRAVFVTSQAIKTLAGPELFRVTSLRGRTRWRYGINTLKATRLFLAAAKFGEIARREPSHVAG
jgi:hypothetical protein